ncbi:MAG: GNAT family N-acetyltransferase [Verrucomicrobia bacterium]|nr:GNAT family N-acetyltransferase [Verrucomicrobiota bacterium]
MKPETVAAVRKPQGAPGLLRRAQVSDLEELMRLESVCFEAWRRDSRRMIRESLGNPRHETWVCPDGPGGAGLTATLTLRRLPGRLRVYSLATDPHWQGRGMGRFLMDFARGRAAECGLPVMRLEADADQASLLEWYERQGFTRETLLKDFYAPGRDAWRMISNLVGEPSVRPE